MKILIIDDDPDVVSYFKTAAQARGHTEIDTAFSGEDALAHVIQSQYDLITLDIRMPGVSGLEILSLLRNMSTHGIIAVVSGHFPEVISPETVECSDVLIAKPVALEKFNALLDGAARMIEALEEIRQLTDVSPPVD